MMEREAKLNSRHKKKLDAWAKTSTGKRALNGVIDYDSLPADLRSELEKIKNTETLWRDTERYLEDLGTSARFGSDRKVAIDLVAMAKSIAALEVTARRGKYANPMREIEAYATRLETVASDLRPLGIDMERYGSDKAYTDAADKMLETIDKATQDARDDIGKLASNFWRKFN